MKPRFALALTLAAATIPSRAHALAPATAAVDIDEHLGQRLPLDLEFTDQDGHAVRLGDELRDGKPVVLVLAYFRCPMLCDLVLRGVNAAVAGQSLVLGKDFRALTVSIDPKDTPAAASLKQRGVLQAMNRPDATAEWPFLVGTQPAIRALADGVGFGYAYDPRTDQYAHPACAIVVTPDGRIARYLYGINFRPFDVRLALVEAGQGRIGGIVDRVLLTCFRYDPTARRYAWAVRGILRVGATLTLLGLAGALLWMLRRERRRRVSS